MYPILNGSTDQPLLFFMADSSNHITGKTGLSPTVTLSKAGGTFASCAGAVTEIANGWYKVAGNAVDAGTVGPLILHATASGADPTDAVFQVTLVDPLYRVLAEITSNIKRKQALAKFNFVMRDSTNHQPVTGATVTCTRSIDGGAFGSGTLANTAELSNGTYLVDFGLGDLDGKVIVLKATASGCDVTFERIITQP